MDNEYEKLAEELKIDRFNVIDECKRHGKKFVAIPDEYIELILQKTKDLKVSSLLCIGVYTVLWFKVDEFNSLSMPIRQKCKLLFNSTERLIMPVFDILEDLCLIVQKKRIQKKNYSSQIS